MRSKLEELEAQSDGFELAGIKRVVIYAEELRRLIVGWATTEELRRLIVVAWAAKTLVKLYDDCPTPRPALDVAVDALREFVGPLVEDGISRA